MNYTERKPKNKKKKNGGGRGMRLVSTHIAVQTTPVRMLKGQPQTPHKL